MAPLHLTGVLALSLCHHAPAHIVDASTPSKKRPIPIPMSPSRQSARLAEAREEVRSLTLHPAVWDPSEKSSSSSGARKKLRCRHLPLFSPAVSEASSEGNYEFRAFDEFASAICEAGIGVARKEAFETWAAAVLIDAHFGAYGSGEGGGDVDMGRVADVAAGHGLLGWALLLLDNARRAGEGVADEGRDDSDSAAGPPDPPPRTVLCVDVRMPPSAVAIRSAMLSRFPGLSSRFHYVEGRLEQLIPHRSCLLASVHACAGLSDKIVGIAAGSGTPVALVPCCHSRKKLDEFASPYAAEEYGSIIAAQGKVPDLADRLDGARMAALRNAGFDVAVEYLPEEFTAKNRLILGAPPNGGPVSPPPFPAKEGFSNCRSSSIPSKITWRSGRMPPVPASEATSPPTAVTATAKELFLAKMTIPCEDSPAPRAKVEALSGRAAADRRRRALHVRDHADCPQFDISMWLAPSDASGQSVVSEEALSRLASGVHRAVCVEASQLGPDFVHSSGRRARTFRLSYRRSVADGVSSPDVGTEFPGLTTDSAKAIHKHVYNSIPRAFPGAECR